MKLTELIISKKQAPLVEGTWSLPDTFEKVQKVMKLLDGPVIRPTDKRARKQIYDLLGSDDLFDALDKAQEDMVDDLRPILIKHLPDFLETERWFKKPDEETQFAINMLKRKYLGKKIKDA